MPHQPQPNCQIFVVIARLVAYGRQSRHLLLHDPGLNCGAVAQPPVCAPCYSFSRGLKGLSLRGVTLFDAPGTSSRSTLAFRFECVNMCECAFACVVHARIGLCVHVCVVCVRVLVGVRLRVCVPVHMSVHVCEYTHMSVHVCAGLDVQVCVCMCVCTRARVCLCVCV